MAIPAKILCEYGLLKRKLLAAGFQLLAETKGTVGRQTKLEHRRLSGTAVRVLRLNKRCCIEC